MITIASIQRAMAAEYDMTLGDMRQPAPRERDNSNHWGKSRPRQAAMALSVLLTEHSLTRIGHFFGGRDRKTVYHAMKATAKRRRTDPKLHQAMRRVTLELVRH
jgi:chromosomal replication initiator protein